MLSIVLPTFNRAQFLPRAFDSIRAQTFRDWELVVIDDGSSDDSKKVVESFARSCPQSVRYLWQSNEGPAGARNNGVKAARGAYIAFFDSDDAWNERHLERCVAALEANPDVDWVCGSFRRVRLTCGEVIDADVFRPRGRPAQFLSLNAIKRGDVNVLADPKLLETALLNELVASLKVSVIKRSIFERLLIPNFRVGEDQAFIARAVAHGIRFGYLDEIHGTAFAHDGNISEIAGTHDIDASVKSLAEVLSALKSLRDLPLNRGERRTLERRIRSHQFWLLGYNCWMAGRHQQAFAFMRGTLAANPVFWKTYLSCRVKHLFRDLNSNRSNERHANSSAHT